MKNFISKNEIITNMKNCEQMKGLSVFKHGVSVSLYFKDLKNHIFKGNELRYEWKLPEWIHEQDFW